MLFRWGNRIFVIVVVSVTSENKYRVLILIITALVAYSASITLALYGSIQREKEWSELFDKQNDMVQERNKLMFELFLEAK